MNNKPGVISESTIARIAGNLLSGADLRYGNVEYMAEQAVKLARFIAAEVERTKPVEEL